VLTPKLLGAAVGAAVAAAIATFSALHTSNELTVTLAAIQKDVGEIKSDVRLLKCERNFPGDCPGQARTSRR
jgi:hypothetical protein